MESSGTGHQSREIWYRIESTWNRIESLIYSTQPDEAGDSFKSEYRQTLAAGLENSGYGDERLCETRPVAGGHPRWQFFMGDTWLPSDHV